MVELMNRLVEASRQSRQIRSLPEVSHAKQT